MHDSQTQTKQDCGNPTLDEMFAFYTCMQFRCSNELCSHETCSKTLVYSVELQAVLVGGSQHQDDRDDSQMLRALQYWSRPRICPNMAHRACPKCQRKNILKCTRVFATAPTVLVVCHRSFAGLEDFVRPNIIKDLDIAQFCLTTDTLPNTKYHLLGFLVHHPNADGGHYIAYVKRDNQWWRLDDERVNCASPEEVGQQCAYILFFRQQSSC